MTCLYRYQAYDSYQVDVTRETVRAIIMKKGHILMMYSSVLDDYTLPGGGIEVNESKEEALMREVKEETGMEDIQINDYIGYSEQYIYDFYDASKKMKRINHYYLVSPGEIFAQALTKQEKAYGFKPKWIRLEDALNHNNSITKNRNREQRDTYFLETEKVILNYVRSQYNEKI